jgi:hypothetical protein
MFENMVAGSKDWYFFFSSLQPHEFWFVDIEGIVSNERFITGAYI